MRPDIVIGNTFPDYELPDHDNVPRRLSDLQGRDPMIVVLSRGSYCPKDQEQHRRLTDLQLELEVGYCRLVTISTDDVSTSRQFRATVDARWPFLSDPGRVIQQDLDIPEYTDPHHNPMVPYTFVLAPGLVIHTLYNGYWYFGRPTLDDLRHDLRAVLRNCRSDYDLGAPGLRGEWDAHDRQSFY